jgi:hypothetical protein
VTTTVQIQGLCDPRFTAAREVFAENFAKRGDVGPASTAPWPMGVPWMASTSCTPQRSTQPSWSNRAVRMRSSRFRPGLGLGSCSRCVTPLLGESRSVQIRARLGIQAKAAL